MMAFVVPWRDDAFDDLGAECKFRVRETQEWKVHAAAFEAEMVRREMLFDVIDWSEDQTTLLFADDA
jgi:hypothetical protein